MGTRKHEQPRREASKRTTDGKSRVEPLRTLSDTELRSVRGGDGDSEAAMVMDGGTIIHFPPP